MNSIMPLEDSFKEMLTWATEDSVLALACTTKELNEKTNELITKIINGLNEKMSINENGWQEFWGLHDIDLCSSLKKKIQWTNVYLKKLEIMNESLPFDLDIRVPKFIKDVFSVQQIEAKTEHREPLQAEVLQLFELGEYQKAFHAASKLSNEDEKFAICQQMDTTLVQDALHWAKCGRWEQALQSALSVQNLTSRWETFSFVICKFETALGLDLQFQEIESVFFSGIDRIEDVSFDEMFEWICVELIKCDRLPEANVIASYKAIANNGYWILAKVFKAMATEGRWEQLLDIVCKVIVNYPDVDLHEETTIDTSNTYPLFPDLGDLINDLSKLKLTRVLMYMIIQLAHTDRLDEAIVALRSFVPDINFYASKNVPQVRAAITTIGTELLKAGRFKDFCSFCEPFELSIIPLDSDDYESITGIILESMKSFPFDDLSMPFAEFLERV